MRYLQTRREEFANVLTHGLMAMLVIAALPFAVLHIYRTMMAEPLTAAVAVAVFCLSLILMFGTSAAYHALPADSRYKLIFNRLDHMAIYFAIAGSYTPLALIVIGGTTGLAVLILEWSLVLAGIIFKVLAFKKSKLNAVISTMFYLLMGWAIVLCLPSFFSQARIACSALILAGGLCYSGGLFFYARQRRYSHVIWHGFVDGGAICHFLAIVLFLS
jgi:hemolysin III